MAVVHFFRNTMRALHRPQSTIAMFVRVNDIVYAKFQGFTIFLHVFASVVKDFLP